MPTSIARTWRTQNCKLGAAWHPADPQLACGVSFDLQIYWQQTEQAIALARAFPDTMLVLDHFGMPIDRTMEGCARLGGCVEPDGAIEQARDIKQLSRE